jgi:sarcosine oxidase gamma subunit
MEVALAAVTLEDFGMDMKALKEAELANGDPYALIPTETVMTSEATGTMRVQSETLALLDEGQWYLVRVNDLQQVAILRQVYPEFSAVEFSGGRVEASE